MSLLLVALSSCRRNLLPHTSMHAPNILTVERGGACTPPLWTVNDVADCRAALEGKLHNDRIKTILDLCNQWTCESRPAGQSTTSPTVQRGGVHAPPLSTVRILGACIACSSTMPPAAMTYSKLLYVIAAGGIVELQAQSFAAHLDAYSNSYSNTYIQ